MRRKPSDWWCLPLYWDEHLMQHAIGEPAFEKIYLFNMREAAMITWLTSPFYDPSLFDAAAWLHEHGFPVPNNRGAV